MIGGRQAVAPNGGDACASIGASIGASVGTRLAAAPLGVVAKGGVAVVPVAVVPVAVAPAARAVAVSGGGEGGAAVAPIRRGGPIPVPEESQFR